MSRKCCGQNLPPKVNEGRHIELSGSGTPQDPLTVSATTELSVEPNETFNLTLSGQGTLESPWLLEVRYASTSRFTDIGDVAIDNPDNGWVAAWDRAAQRWVAAPPAVVPPGTVYSGNGLTGDGSAGSPLTAVANGARYLQVTADGIGLSDGGLNAMIRPFDNAAARAAASPLPTIGTFSVLGTNPDQLDRWDGTTWQPVTNGNRKDIAPGQLLALSGPYAAGATTQYVAQLTITTDSTGAFVVIDADALADYSGVLACTVQETGTTPWHCQVDPGVDTVNGFAYRLSTGEALGNQVLTGVVTAILY